MASTYDVVIRHGTLVNHDGTFDADIGVAEGRIVKIGHLNDASAGEEIDAKGLHVLPGVIDTQVHLREPGMEHKEDLEAGGRAAVLGGVTAVVEMPNTKPPTITEEALEDKVRRASGRMQCDFAFYVGATEGNAKDLGELERLPGCCGVKVFMGSSTGTLLVASDEGVSEVLRHINRRAAFHSEDEYRLRERRPLAELGNVASHPVWRDEVAALKSTERLLRLARAAGKRIHVLHISTAEEMKLLADHKDIASVEVTPQHLTLSAPDCYDELGTLAQMNPPLRGAHHQEGLWSGVTSGVVDVLGTDHAPHTMEEKQKDYPASPSGMPGLQTLMPLMLDHVNAGRLSLERLVDLTSYGAARLFGLIGRGRLAVGCDANITLVDLKTQRIIENERIASKCGWTPFAGKAVTGWPIATIIRGQRVMFEDEILGAPMGRPMRFEETEV